MIGLGLVIGVWCNKADQQGTRSEPGARLEPCGSARTNAPALSLTCPSYACKERELACPRDRSVLIAEYTSTPVSISSLIESAATPFPIALDPREGPHSSRHKGIEVHGVSTPKSVVRTGGPSGADEITEIGPKHWRNRDGLSVLLQAWQKAKSGQGVAREHPEVSTSGSFDTPNGTRNQKAFRISRHHKIHCGEPCLERSISWL